MIQDLTVLGRRWFEGWDAWNQGALVQSLQPGPRP